MEKFKPAGLKDFLQEHSMKNEEWARNYIKAHGLAWIAVGVDSGKIHAKGECEDSFPFNEEKWKMMKEVGEFCFFYDLPPVIEEK